VQVVERYGEKGREWGGSAVDLLSAKYRKDKISYMHMSAE
jgi:hypothetical protein